MFKHCFGLLCFLIVLLGAVQSAAARTWTDNSGNSMQAEFVRVSSGTVMLKRGGKVIRVPLNNLSTEDQAWIASKQKAKKPQAWKTKDGKTVRGTFVRIDNGEVVVRSAGRTVKVKWSDLEEKNREWLQEVLTGFGREDELPQEDRAPERDAFGDDLNGSSDNSDSAEKPEAEPENAFGESDSKEESATEDSDSHIENAFGDDDSEEEDAKAGEDEDKIWIEDEKEWEDDKGRVIKAVFIKLKDGKVHLLKDGKKFAFPLSRLSFKSQAAARHLQWEVERKIRGRKLGGMNSDDWYEKEVKRLDAKFEATQKKWAEEDKAAREAMKNAREINKNASGINENARTVTPNVKRKSKASIWRNLTLKKVAFFVGIFLVSIAGIMIMFGIAIMSVAIVKEDGFGALFMLMFFKGGHRYTSMRGDGKHKADRPFKITLLGLAISVVGMLLMKWSGAFEMKHTRNYHNSPLMYHKHELLIGETKREFVLHVNTPTKREFAPVFLGFSKRNRIDISAKLLIPS